jgi:hypothetical protein
MDQKEQTEPVPPPEKTYLGDGAYAAFDGYQIVLTAENGISATDTVALEPGVWDALVRWVKRLDEFKADWHKRNG